MDKKTYIDIFNDTLRESRTQYKEDTEDLVIRNTKVYAIDSIDKSETAYLVEYNTKFRQVHMCSTEAAHMNFSDRIAVVNFTDMQNTEECLHVNEITEEGKLFLVSNLYQSLISEDVQEDFYGWNLKVRETKGGLGQMFHLLYSKDVLFFKEIDYMPLDRPTYYDVITAAIPLRCQSEEVVIEYLDAIFRLGIQHNIEDLIFGMSALSSSEIKWKFIDRCFNQLVLKYKKSPIKNVIFAFEDDSFRMSNPDVECDYKIRKVGIIEHWKNKR